MTNCFLYFDQGRANKKHVLNSTVFTPCKRDQCDKDTKCEQIEFVPLVYSECVYLQFIGYVVDYCLMFEMNFTLLLLLFVSEQELFNADEIPDSGKV